MQGISSIWPRSFCPACKTTIAWYDLVPVLSWVLLRAQCRRCKVSISWLYPFIELITALVFTLGVFRVEPQFWLGYGLLASALIVTLRTDIEYMLISRYTTIALIPVAFILSSLDLLPINLTASILGSLFGYSVLWVISYIFYKLRHVQGMGEGDLDLLATIGAFTGFTGAWISLLLGSIAGAVYSIYLVIRYKVPLQTTKIPFGPWLCAGALIFMLYGCYITYLFLAF